MKGKLTPKESFILYGVWIVVAFGFFFLGLYWGRSQATGLGQEISTQPAGPISGTVPAPQMRTRLDLPKEPAPAAKEQEAVPAPSASPAPATSGKSAVKQEQKPPVVEPAPAAATAATRTAKPPTAAPVAGKEVFSIQVGAVKTEEEARKIIARLENRGFTGILEKPASAGDSFYRVRVGSYTRREDAARAESLLKDEGFLTFIKKVK